MIIILKEIKKRSIGNSLSWIFSLIFIFASFGGFVSLEIISAFAMLIIGIVLLPPTNKFIYDKFKFKLTKGIKTIIIIVGFVIFGVFSDFTSNSTNQATPQQLKPAVSIKEKQLISDDLTSLHFNYFDREFGLTDLQKEEDWKDYKGKYVKWDGYVKSIDDTFSGIKLLMSYAPSGTGVLFGTHASITMKDSEKDKLLKYNKGDFIKIQARLDNYHNVLRIFSLDEGEVIDESNQGLLTLEDKNKIYSEAKLSKDYSTCDDLTEQKSKLTCIAGVAIELKDLETCKSLPEELPGRYAVRGWCIIGIAKNTSNSQLCQEIKNVDRKKECLGYFNKTAIIG